MDLLPKSEPSGLTGDVIFGEELFCDDGATVVAEEVGVCRTLDLEFLACFFGRFTAFSNFTSALSAMTILCSSSAWITPFLNSSRA